MMKQRKMKQIAKSVVCSVIIFVLFVATPGRAYADTNVGISSTKSTNISIDGYFDDWEDKPMSALTWGSYNGTEIHDVSLIKDDNYIYIYLAMDTKYNSGIPVDAIYLYINNQLCQMFIRYENSQHSTDWSRPLNLNKAGIFTGLHPFTYYPNNSLGDAAAAVYESGTVRDKLEIRININDLEKVMGLKAGTINNGSQIKLQMPNVGGGTISLLGTSTGTLIGVILCIGTVVFVNYRRNKKARLTP